MKIIQCHELLNDGVCATIGPAYEPYLGSFPRPDEFFGLLLQGELTLVECFARSNPFNSWMMTLIGDPLYRPFKYRLAAQPPAAAGRTQELQAPPSAALTPANPSGR